MYGLRYANELPIKVRKEFEGLVAAFKEVILAEHNEDGTHRIADPNLAIVPLGGCIPYTAASVNTPRGWLLADGTAVSRVTYKSYFDLVGTTYGSGDGSLTFNLPDMRQRFPLGKAASGTGATLGDTGGAIDHTHSMGSHTHSISSDGGHTHSGNTGSNGAHTHTFSDTSSGASGSSGTGTGFPSGGDVPDMAHTHDVSGTTDDPGNHAHSISSDGSHTHGGATGSSSGTSGAENPPFLAVNYIVYVGV